MARPRTKARRHKQTMVAEMEEEVEEEKIQMMSNRTRRWALPVVVVLLAICWGPLPIPPSPDVSDLISNLNMPQPPQELMNYLDQIDLTILEDISNAGGAAFMTVMDVLRSQWKDLNLTALESLSNLLSEDEKYAKLKRPGLEALEKGIEKKFPIVIIPGATTTGLEIWKGKPCAKAHFKQRLWGSVGMFGSLATMDWTCWLEHISLNLTTGLDPEGIKVRPAEGMANVEHFIPGFWIWAQIVESLADIGYDSSDMYAHTYDWRLSPDRLEARDGFLTRMKHTFESSYEIHQKPACVLSHSYGDLLLRYFLSWVESEQGGRGGNKWVKKYIGRYVNIGGPMLGAPKVLTALTSGDTSDSIWLPDFAPYLTGQHILSKSGRAQWFRTMTSGKTMLPQGGEAIWGSPTQSIDDTNINRNTSYSYGTYMCIAGDSEDFGKENERECVPLSVTDAIHLMFDRSGEIVRKNYDMEEINEAYSKSDLTASHKRKKRWGKAGTQPKLWGHALMEPLPLAPDMKIYCLYGVGVPTERSYQFKYDKESDALHIDTSITIPEMKVEKGIQYSDGDGTVPLSSLGYMCVEGWKKKKVNPANIQVTTREYSHDPLKLSIRGGPRASDHVNILGNYEMIYNILEIASGMEVEERIHSQIKKVAKQVPF